MADGSQWQISNTIFISSCCCYQFRVLKQHECIVLLFQRWEVWNGYYWIKIKVLAGLSSSLESPGKNLFSWLYHFWEAAHIPFPVASSSIFKTKNCQLSPSPNTSPWHWSFCLHVSYLRTHYYTGSSWISRIISPSQNP